MGLPDPDSPGGLAIFSAIALGSAYLLLLVGAYSALSAEALWVVTLNLVLGVVVSTFLVSMIAADRARATAFELEFARTVQAHVAAGESLVEASPLGGILREYAHAATEQRHAAREHAYAASPALFSTALALVATLLVGLAYVGGGVPDLIGVGLVFELGGFVFLVLTAGALAFSVGRDAEVLGFDTMVLRRWSQVARPTFPFTHSLGDVPWASEGVAPAASPSPWQESTATPASSP
jgi:hypothetical protein